MYKIGPFIFLLQVGSTVVTKTVVLPLPHNDLFLGRGPETQIIHKHNAQTTANIIWSCIYIEICAQRLRSFVFFIFFMLKYTKIK